MTDRDRWEISDEGSEPDESTPEEQEDWWRFVRRIQENLQTRRQHGEYHRLVQELRLDGERFQRYFRLDRAQFDELLTRVGPRITRLETNWRSPISAAERLQFVSDAYLATGDSYRSIAYSYRVGITTVGYIIPEVATAIWECLVSEFMPVPKKEDWMTIAEEFRQHWNFPNCLGSIDGKHVNIQAPSKSGSLYLNYKGTYSIVLLAVVDARYRFRVVDVGAYGRRSDGGTLASSKFGKALQNGRLDLPEDRLLPEAEHLGCQRHVFVADEAFPLQRHLTRPFPGPTSPEGTGYSITDSPAPG
ncbi:hypothetical protein AAFF_G00034060 [Aldrovandia affinis]|uniref:DDE Tnp4 domain-containing protein n=1 Tax=Aldrovandia affinis TaxID=143900 RepID=A0AAD7R282_9TELE|nr:hypothetical protein AAFF_G00034060 [Aldrovandia affinis]